MAAGAQEQPGSGQARRRSPRFHVRAPLDVTVLRSGIPDKVPGRTMNLCDRGVGAMLAGELVSGEVVAVELRLPALTDPFRARATVRYQDKLRCGLEFVGVTPEQRGVIRHWARETKAEADSRTGPRAFAVKGQEKVTEAIKPAAKNRAVRGTGVRNRRVAILTSSRSQRRSVTLVGVALAGILALAVWWRWNSSWHELEASAANPEAAAGKPQAQVSADVMEQLLIHRVEPTYPSEARRDDVQGIIALDIIVGRDGSVISMHPLNGPEILARAAMDALRWWKFEPYRINGEPAVAETTVAVEFKR
jgi:TonB family protein